MDRGEEEEEEEEKKRKKLVSFFGAVRSAELKRIVLRLDEDPAVFARRAADAVPKTSILQLPDPSTTTSGGILDVLRVALTAFDLARNMRPEFVVVPNMGECAFTNKSLPANAGALKQAAGRCAVYLFDVRNDDIREAVLRRDFIRSIGQIFYDVFSTDIETLMRVRTPKSRERDLRTYVDVFTKSANARRQEETAVARRRKAAEEDDEIVFDPWYAYDNFRCPSSSSEKGGGVSKMLDLFSVSCAIEKCANDSKDFHALCSLAEGIREAAASTLCPGVQKSCTRNSASQMLNRCGLHANLSGDLAMVSVVAGRSPSVVLSDPGSVQCRRLKTTFNYLYPPASK